MTDASPPAPVPLPPLPADAHPARAMILAAGRGERMRPLTDHCPKPLLQVRGQPLMAWPMQALARQGVDEVVVNTAWLGQQIEDHFGPQSAWGKDSLLSKDERAAGRASDSAAASAGLRTRIHYSREGADFSGALETAGGIVRALPWLADVFWIAAGDVYAPGFAFEQAACERFAAGSALAHLWLVPNPAHHPQGDFGLAPDGRVLNAAPEQFTYSTIGLYRKAFFDGQPVGNPQGLKLPLAPLLRAAIERGQVTGEVWRGEWTDVGTPERLAALNG